MLKQNENNLDKNIRLVVGALALLLAAFVFTGALQIAALVVGILGIFTGLTGFCLIYKLLGISTKKQ
jgi:hypothetical protein